MKTDANPIYDREYESDFLNALDACIDDFWDDDCQEAEDEAYLETLTEEEREKVQERWLAEFRAWQP